MSTDVSSKSRETIISALTSGVICALVSAPLNPFDVIKIRLQNINKYNNFNYIYDNLYYLYTNEGMAGLCRGIHASMLREIVYSSIRIGAYEPIRDSISVLISLRSDSKDISQYSNLNPINPSIKYLSALVSGGIGAAIANPFDLIKTRFQATTKYNIILPYSTFIDAIKYISHTEGLRGLYKGKWVVIKC